jgi:hypothetical protein
MRGAARIIDPMPAPAELRQTQTGRQSIGAARPDCRRPIGPALVVIFRPRRLGRSRRTDQPEQQPEGERNDADADQLFETRG